MGRLADVVARFLNLPPPRPLGTDFGPGLGEAKDDYASQLAAQLYETPLELSGGLPPLAPTYDSIRDSEDRGSVERGDLQQQQVLVVPVTTVGEVVLPLRR